MGDEVDQERATRPVVTLADVQKWVRVQFGGVYVADSTRVKLLRSTGRPPVYLFPEGDVDMECLSEPSGEGRLKLVRGTRTVGWTVRAGGKKAEGGAWTHPEAGEGVPDLRGYVGFEWGAMDAWFEEEEEVYVHPRDPFRRVDDLPSSRHIEVRVAGQLVADSRRPVVLFETGLPERYYLPKTDVRMDLLVASDTVTRCPYKGEATYYSVGVGEKLVEDIAWCYRYPLPESSRIAGHICFHGERVEVVHVDGRSRDV